MRFLFILLLATGAVAQQQLMLQSPIAAAAGAGITLDAGSVTTFTNDSISGGVSVTNSVTVSGDNSYLILIAGSSYSTIGSVTAVKYAGQDLTRLCFATHQDTANVGIEAWALKNPASGENPLIFTCGSGYFNCLAMNWNGVNQTTPYSASLTNTTHYTITNSVITSAVGEVVVDCVTGTMLLTYAPTAPLTLISESRPAADYPRYCAAAYVAGATSVTNFWTDTEVYALEFALSLKP